MMEFDAPIREKGMADVAKVERILSAATVDAVGCLIAAQIGCDGYATAVKDQDGKAIASYRLVYRVKVGPIAPGEQIHHACANRACINPKHLVVATQRENVGEMLARLSYERQIAHLEAENGRLRARIAELEVT